MRKALLLPYAFLAVFPALLAQGFNNTYSLGLKALLFSNLDISNDTITLIGLNFDSAPPYDGGISFLRVDTLGNILDHKTYYSDEDYSTPNAKQGFVKLIDSQGYVIVGTHFSSQSGYLLRLDSEGNLLFSKQYPKENSLVFYWNSIIEVEHGFMVSGTKQTLTYNANTFVAKLDKEGNVNWIKDYDSGLVFEVSCDFVQINENEFVLSQSSFVDNQGQLSDNEQYTQLFFLDSLGNQTGFWESEPDLKEGGAVGLQKLDNGDWLYATSQLLVDDEFEVYEGLPKIVRRDSNMNLIWQKSYGFPSWESRGFFDLKPYPGGGYVGTGFLSDMGTETGLVCRVDENGNQMWLRQDTAWYQPQTGLATNELAAAAFLSSGSIIACGQTIDWAEPKSYGWLLKITPDGCIDTLLCAPSAAPSGPPGGIQLRERVQAFPNPADGQLHFRRKGGGGGTLVISDVQGRTQAVLPWPPGEAALQLDVSKFPDGLYFYRMQVDTGAFYSGKFLVQH